jgi:hypothetical protein
MRGQGLIVDAMDEGIVQPFCGGVGEQCVTGTRTIIGAGLLKAGWDWTKYES